MAQIFTSYSDREFKEILSENVKEAVKEALDGETAEKPDTTPTEHWLQDESRDTAHARRGLFHHAPLKKAGILVPRRIDRKVYYSDEAICDALAKSGKELK